jgi:hypothetical protein
MVAAQRHCDGKLVADDKNGEQQGEYQTGHKQFLEIVKNSSFPSDATFKTAFGWQTDFKSFLTAANKGGARCLTNATISCAIFPNAWTRPQARVLLQTITRRFP